MKYTLLAILMALGAPAFAREGGYYLAFGLQGGQHTVGLRYEAGISEASSNRGGFRLPVLGVDLLQATRTGQHDLRVHILGLGYDFHIAENLNFQVAATPFGSLGGITGPGFGGEAFVGLRYKDLSFGAYTWSASGRPNPWDGQKSSSETGLVLRLMF